MDEQSAAIINFFGQTFGQMKEIDKNIEAAGSNAKFGGRSAEVEKALRGFVDQIQAPSPTPTAPLPLAMPVQTFVDVQPVISNQVSVVHEPQPTKQEEQLELKFSTSDKDVLNDIYNVLFDIRKLIAESIELQKQQLTTAPKKQKKQSVLAPCCLCGAEAKGKKVSEKLFTITCEGCKNSENGNNELSAKVAWNNNNKQL